MNRSGASASLGFWVFLAALLVRLTWVVYRSAGQPPALEFDDESLHWQLARNLVSTGQMVSDDGRVAARMPVYPLFLALFAWLGDGGIILVRLTQAALGAVTAWLVFRFGAEALGARAGLIAGTLATLDLYAVFFANLLLTETLFTLIGVGLTYATWRLLTRGDEGHRWLMMIAALGPLAVMTRPSSAGWLVLIWVLVGGLAAARAQTMLRTGVLIGASALLMIPWGVRNQVVIGGCAWLSTNGGVTLYDAQGPQATGAGDQSFLNQMPELADLDEIATDQRLGALAREQMWREPGRVFRLAWAKLLRTWSLWPNYQAYRAGLTGWASALFMLPVLLGALCGPVYVLTTLGTPLARYRRLVLIGLLWLPILYFTAVHCVYIGSLRYRVPVMPFVELSAAALFFAPARRHEGVRSQARLWTQVTSRT